MFEKKENGIALFKAFYTIDLNILLKKLACYGVRRVALDWNMS